MSEFTYRLALKFFRGVPVKTNHPVNVKFTNACSRESYNIKDNRHPLYQCWVYEFRHLTSRWSKKSWWRFGMEFKVFLNFESHAKVCFATTKLAWGMTDLTFEGLKFTWQASFLWFIKSTVRKGASMIAQRDACGRENGWFFRKLPFRETQFIINL